MAHDTDDADAIRARRALLISTALAALSCGSPGDGVVPSTSVTSVASTSGPTSTATTSAKSSVPPSRPWAKVMAEAPPRGVPTVVTGPEAEWLKHLENDLEKRYETVRLVWEATPGCDAAASDCRATWRELGVKAKAMYDANRGRGFGGCGGANGETGSLVARRSTHEQYLQALIGELEGYLTQVAEGFSPQGGQEWQRLLANAKKPPPMPCLSPCARPEVSELLQWVQFEQGASTIADETALKQTVATFKANQKPSKIVVRGHADAGEPKPQELAKARAEKVAAWLIANGVPKDRVETKSFGADFPLRKAAPKDGIDINRRVDFEAVPL